jgi:hypothetical protein
VRRTLKNEFRGVQLRAWLLRTYRMPLSTLSVAELRLIAEGKIREARQSRAGNIDSEVECSVICAPFHRPNLEDTA